MMHIHSVLTSNTNILSITGVEQERQLQRAQTTNTPSPDAPTSPPPQLDNPMTKNQNHIHVLPSPTNRRKEQVVGLQEGVGMSGKQPQRVPVGISATIERLKRNRKISIPVGTAGNSGTILPVSSSASVSDISSSTNAGGNSPTGDGSSTTGVSTRMEDVIKYPLSGSASPPF